jgi:anti-sigma-K factor RskA
MSTAWSEHLQKSIAAEYARTTDPVGHFERQAAARRAEHDKQFEAAVARQQEWFGGWVKTVLKAWVVAACVAGAVSLASLGLLVWGVGALAGKW